MRIKLLGQKWPQLRNVRLYVIEFCELIDTIRVRIFIIVNRIQTVAPYNERI